MSETIFVQGVPRRPLLSKFNPLWWFGNDEASAQGNTFYYKYIRNPVQNLRWYVLGLVDRPHWVTGRAPAITNQRSDLTPPQAGICLSIIWLGPVPMLPYFSIVTHSVGYKLDWHPTARVLQWIAKRSLVFYIGWQPAGALGAKLNFSNSDLP